MKKMILSIVLICIVLAALACNKEVALVSVVEEVEPVEEAEVTEVVEEVKEEVVVVEPVLFDEEDLDNPMLPATLTYIGRATMRIEFADETVVYIDPYAGEAVDYEIPADLVLVTHQHSDHNNTSKVTLKEEGQIIMCPTDILEGDVITFGGLEITAVPAYNSNHKRERCCGFIIKTGNTVLYHSGDTSNIPEMAALVDYNIDYAFLTMDGVWNMSHVEAKLVADTIRAEVIIPIHTDGDDDWNNNVARAFDYDNKRIVKPGETLEIK